MTIAEIVEKAKRDIDVGYFDKPLKKRRMKIVLVDRGSMGRCYQFAGKFSQKDLAMPQQYKTPDYPVKGRCYEASDFGMPENKYNYF